jgi:protein O-GlcNAc transferase
MMAKGLETIFLKARNAERRGDGDQARQLYEAILREFPNNNRAMRALRRFPSTDTSSSPTAGFSGDVLAALMGLYRAGRFAELIRQAEPLHTAHDPSAGLEQLLGAAYAGMGRFADAETAFARWTRISPDDPQAWYNLGVAQQEQALFDRAIQAYGRTLAIRRDHVDALFNSGVAHHALNRLGDAAEIYRQTLALAPGHVAAHYNLGNALKAQNLTVEAVAAYDSALSIDPSHGPAHNNRGVALQQLRRIEEAIESYRRSLAIDPANADAWNNIGNALRETGRLDEAIAAFDNAIAQRPSFAAAHNNLGNAYRDRGDIERAIAAYQDALAAAPGWSSVIAQKLHQQAQICDWRAFDEFAAIGDRLGTVSGAVPPFTLLNFEDAPERQLARSRLWASETYGACERAAPLKQQSVGKMKIGYFSADFHDHATMYLMIGLFRAHDRARFDIHIYSYGTINAGSMRDELIAHVDSFTDVASMSDVEIAELARRDAIDIAVDLKGYTIQNRTGLFRHRPAPVQISFLGYPGSLGADFMDYIVADPVVIPSMDCNLYTEKAIFLPHSYQPNDDRRPISATNTTRADHGLPEDRFVFCCFNNSYKIAPAEFGIWMRLLGQIEGSVLWLLGSNRRAEENLRNEATRRGIAGDRIIFAGLCPLPEHLARHRHADLFLDTFNYNAHTTASDALWAGLPVLTKAGRQFPARVGASLLTAVGLPHLITRTADHYERLALELARSPDRLDDIRRQLAQNRADAALFDTALFARHLEAGYTAAFERHANGLAPEHIRIADSRTI